MTVRLVLAATALAGQGCAPTLSRQLANGDDFATIESLKPDMLPYKEGSLILAGTRIPVELRQRRTGSQFVLDVLTHDEVIESETYVVESDTFSFADLSGESFDPPIPIARFPFRAGDSWSWNGKARLGSISKTARGALTSSKETLNLASGQRGTVRVDVALEIDAGAAEPAKRVLKFWFEPERGIVRREFGSSSSREPRAPEVGTQ